MASNYELSARISEVFKADPVLIAGGDNDAATADGLGLTAICHSAAMGSWLPYIEVFRGKTVWVLADADAAGVAQAKYIAGSLVGIAKSIRLIEAMPQSKNLTEWVERGGTLAALLKLISSTGEWKPGARLSGRPLDGPVLRRASEVMEEPLEWVWPGVLVKKNIALFFGEPGVSKTLCAIDIAARLTTGRQWPDGSWPCGSPVQIGQVIYMSAEDDLASTLKPRLVAAGGNPSLVSFLTGKLQTEPGGKQAERVITLADIDDIEKAVTRDGGAMLLILDPVSAYLGKADMNNAAHVRNLLTPLKRIADRCRCAVLMISHASKARQKTINRALGSGAQMAAARTAWIFKRDPDDPDRVLMLPVKNNLAKNLGGFSYRVEDYHYTSTRGDLIETAKIGWEAGRRMQNPDDDSEEETVADRVGRIEAQEWLRDFLSQGPRQRAEIVKESHRDGISERSLRDARYRLGVKAEREGFQGGSMWQLPDVSPQP
jgi:hypothetical protein